MYTFLSFLILASCSCLGSDYKKIPSTPKAPSFKFKKTHWEKKKDTNRAPAEIILVYGKSIVSSKRHKEKFPSYLSPRFHADLQKDLNMQADTPYTEKFSTSLFEKSGMHSLLDSPRINKAFKSGYYAHLAHATLPTTRKSFLHMCITRSNEAAFSTFKEILPSNVLFTEKIKNIYEKLLQKKGVCSFVKENWKLWQIIFVFLKKAYRDEIEKIKLLEAKISEKEHLNIFSIKSLQEILESFDENAINSRSLPSTFTAPLASFLNIEQSEKEILHLISYKDILSHFTETTSISGLLKSLKNGYPPRAHLDLTKKIEKEIENLRENLNDTAQRLNGCIFNIASSFLFALGNLKSSSLREIDREKIYPYFVDRDLENLT